MKTLVLSDKQYVFLSLAFAHSAMNALQSEDTPADQKETLREIYSRLDIDFVNGWIEENNLIPPVETKETT